MATPKKVSSISLTSTNLSDSALPITEFDKATLISFLNSVTSSQVTLFFSEESSGSETSNNLIIAGLDTNGNPSATQQLSSASLPCPPYCTK